jgi:hypothetical protein
MRALTPFPSVVLPLRDDRCPVVGYPEILELRVRVAELGSGVLWINCSGRWHLLLRSMRPLSS